MAHFQFAGRMNGPQDIIAVAQDLTGDWVNLGDEIPTAGSRWATLWTELDINDSTGVRVRLVGRHTLGGADYPVPTLTIGAVAVDVQAGYFEFPLNENQNLPLGWDINGTFPFCQFQVMATVVGAAAGQIDSAVLTTGV